MTTPETSVPLRDAEVRAITYRTRFGLRRYRGHLVYRMVAGRGIPFGSFWLEYRKVDGFSGAHPLCKARSKELLLEKLRVEAAMLGHVTAWTEEVRTNGL